MLRPKLLYFLYYAAMASLLPFLVLYYEHLDLSGRQIGVLSALLPVMTLTVPLWSAAADLSGRYRAALLLSVGGAAAFTLTTPLATTYAGLLASVGALALFVAPVMPFADHAVLTLLREGRHRYGHLRLWGAVGWGVAAPLAGLLVEREVRAAFVLAALLLGLLVFVVGGLPAPARAGAGAARPRVRQFLTPKWAGLVAAAFVGGVCLAVSGTFLYLHLADLGVRSSLIGLALTVATLSEVPVFLLAGRLLRRYAAPALLAAALAVFAARLLLYSVAASPWLLLGAQGLHGASFSLLWAAGVAYADTLAPAGLRATAQGLFTTVVMGWGGVAGALVGGVLYDAAGAAALFRWTGLSAALGAALGIVWTVWTTRRDRALSLGDAR